ncbi:MAG: GAF domain-containing sensor histidine kinase [Candidatus Sungbacteria bacterium]|nr:GAF domain-containing sensor histidine kinase [Candidatus Sungbacteria bacterium]
MFSFLTRKIGGAASQTSADENFKEVTETLYKRNSELVVKNKTLSILRQLYQTSIQTFKPKALGEEVVKIVREALELELVGIFTTGEENKTLYPLAFAVSGRLRKIEVEFGHSFEKYTISNIEENPFLREIIRGRSAHHKDGLGHIWKDVIPEHVRNFVVKEVHIKTTLGYPLIINNKVIGALILFSNRKFDELAEYEKESLAIFADVVAVALDKAELYEQLRVMNDKLGEANARLKELDAQKSEFVSIAGHQLRTPLTVIKGYISLVQEGEFGAPRKNKKLQNALQIVANSTDQLVKLVSDLLDLSRIESGKIHYEFKEADFVKMMQGIVTEYTPAAKKKGLKLVFENHAENLAPFLFDADKMREVAVNIIDNAMKYSKEGSISVMIEEADKDKTLRFSVKDHGLGIKKEDIPKLFVKFNRLPEAKNLVVNGTGIGLYFAKRIVEDHGGRVGVESPGPGNGSTFWVEIPIRKGNIV